MTRARVPSGRPALGRPSTARSGSALAALAALLLTTASSAACGAAPSGSDPGSAAHREPSATGAAATRDSPGATRRTAGPSRGSSGVSAPRTPAPGGTTAPADASRTAARAPSSRAASRSGSGARFQWRVQRVSAGQLGRSWRAGCPVGPAQLRRVELTHWDFAGRARTGVLVLNADVVERTRPVFETMFETRFPLRSVRPVTDFGASDDASMAADNTSAFNCRRAVAAGSPTWSRHAYGRAIDINPVENPYLFAGRVLPPAGARYRDRDRAVPGLVTRGGAVHRAFAAAGYRWGGDFGNPDYQHFDR